MADNRGLHVEDRGADPLVIAEIAFHDPDVPKEIGDPPSVARGTDGAHDFDTRRNEVAQNVAADETSRSRQENAFHHLMKRRNRFTSPSSCS